MNLILFKEAIQKRLLFLALALICMAFVPKSYAEESNLKINLGITLRNSHNDDQDVKTQIINFGLVSDLFNHYYDF